MIEPKKGNWLPIGPDTPTTDPALINEIYEFCESYTPISPQNRIIVTAEIPLRQETAEKGEQANPPQPIGDQ